MLKISDAIETILRGHPFLEFGLSHKLFNLSQLSRFMQPLVEARTQKEVRPSALTMALSRYQNRKSQITPSLEKFGIESLSVYGHLGTMTFAKNLSVYKTVHKLHSELRTKNQFFAFSESMTEVTIFFERSSLQTIQSILPEDPKYEHQHISCIGIRFDEKYIAIPGLLSTILQKLSLQYINFVEISSTYTEFNIYLDEKDIKLAFETLHSCFNVS